MYCLKCSRNNLKSIFLTIFKIFKTPQSRWWWRYFIILLLLWEDNNFLTVVYAFCMCMRVFAFKWWQHLQPQRLFGVFVVGLLSSTCNTIMMTTAIQLYKICKMSFIFVADIWLIFAVLLLLALNNVTEF